MKTFVGCDGQKRFDRGTEDQDLMLCIDVVLSDPRKNIFEEYNGLVGFSRSAPSSF